MKLLTVVVIYNPNLELLIENLKPLISSPHIDEIIMWNNSNETPNLELENIKIFSTGKNEGLSFAYNFAYNYAKINGFTHLMTMDQDSIWVNLEEYLKQIKSFNKIGIYTVSPNIKYNGEICEINDGINSGSVISLEVLDATNGFYKDFFIDAIDEYLHYEAQRLGYKVFLVGNCYIKQRVGASKPIHLLGKKLYTVLNYSPMRLYEMERNHTILLKLFNLPKKKRRSIIMLYYIRIPFNIIFSEKNKFNKIKAILMGIYDGVKNKKNRILEIK